MWQVQRYDIRASINAGVTERALAVRATIAARNIGGAGRTFTVRLNPAVEVASATIDDAPARFTKREDTATKLQLIVITLPAPVERDGTLTATYDYRLPVGDNTGLAAISPEGAQFLPLAFWYPTPNSPYAPRGADTAPVRLTVEGATGDTVVASGESKGTTFEQALSAQPFFLTGKWDVVEGTGEAKDISAWMVAGASADERQRAEALVAVASAARTFYGSLLGNLAAPARVAPVRLVAVRRGAGFDSGGTLLLDASVFRRAKTDAATAMLIAETLARVWVGGATAVEAEGAGAVREGLARYLALQFIEKQFGREASEAERQRMVSLYVPIARRDAPLSQSTPLDDAYYTSVSNKGALAWRLVERIVGRENFLAVLRREFDPARGGRVSLASLRAALGEGANAELRRTMQGLFDQPTDTDLLVGLPQQRAGEWVAAVRNVGPFDVAVTVEAMTERGERLTSSATIKAQDFGEARFSTPARITRIEIDPDKLYPQLDYANDVAPRVAASDETLSDITRQFAQQQFAAAETTARELVRRAPLLQEARINLARALLEQNKLDEAEKEFRAAFDLPLPTAATLAWANIGLGEVALRRNQPADAARRFDVAARADADYATALNARAARVKAEAAARTAPAADESVRAFVAQLDQAIQSGRQAQIRSVVVPGELSGFERGLVGSQPELWQTRVLRTEAHGTNRMAVDVAINAKTLGQTTTGTALFILARTGAGWQLADIQLFEVR